MKSIFESFIYGILAALLALILEAVFGMFLLEKLELTYCESLKSLVFSYSGIFLLFSAAAEEMAKFLLIFKSIRPISFARRRMVTNSLIAGIGFSAIELTLLRSKYDLSVEGSYLEVLKLIIFHCSTFGIIGYYSIVPQKIHTFILRVILPLTFVHFAYNLFAFCPNVYSDYARIIVLSALVLLTAKALMSTKSKLANS